MVVKCRLGFKETSMRRSEMWETVKKISGIWKKEKESLRKDSTEEDGKSDTVEGERELEERQ
jgi:hypothetical protein